MRVCAQRSHAAGGRKGARPLWPPEARARAGAHATLARMRLAALRCAAQLPNVEFMVFLRESPLSPLNSSTARLPVFSMTGARATRLPLGSSTDSVISVCARLPVRHALPNYLPACLPSYPRDALRLWF